MKMYLLEPEVPGEIGDQSVLVYEDGVLIQAVHLHYEFAGWLGDDVITTHPFFMVSEGLARGIELNELSGYEFAELEVSTSKNFRELYPQKVLPTFKRLVPLGRVEIKKRRVTSWSGHDLCLTDRSCLVVSEKAFQVFQRYKMKHCEILELQCN